MRLAVGMSKYALVSSLCILGATLVLSRTDALGQSTSTGSTFNDAAPDNGLIDRSIADLDAPQYETRMAATRRLIEQGEPIVPMLEFALRNRPSMELQSRGLEVLGRIAREKLLTQGTNSWRLDGGIAEVTLQSLAADESSALAVRASRKLNDLKQYQRQAAIARLTEQGAKISDRRIINGNWPNVVRQATFAKDWKGTAEDLTALQYVNDLEAVTLDGPFVSAKELKAIQALQNLTMIEIKHAHVDDSDLALLTNFPQLQLLHIFYTPITDNAISTLVGISPQQQLALYGTKISQKGHEQLTVAMPGCTVDYRQGAFLGIGGPEIPIPGTTGCVVNKVQPDSAAARAGILLNDIIIAYNGKPVRSFEEIRDQIGQNAAGDRVEVELLRNNQPLKTTVVLGEWE